MVESEKGNFVYQLNELQGFSGDHQQNAMMLILLSEFS